MNRPATPPRSASARSGGAPGAALLSLAILAAASATAATLDQVLVHEGPAYRIHYPGDWTASRDETLTAFTGRPGTAAEYARLELHTFPSGPGGRFASPGEVMSFFKRRLPELFPGFRFHDEGHLVYRGAGGKHEVPTFKGEYEHAELGLTFRLWLIALPNSDPQWLHGVLYAAPVRIDGADYYARNERVVQEMLGTLITRAEPATVVATRRSGRGEGQEGRIYVEQAVAFLDDVVTGRTRRVAGWATAELARDLAQPATREALRAAGLHPDATVARASARRLPDDSVAVHLRLERAGAPPLIATVTYRGDLVRRLDLREVR